MKDVYVTDHIPKPQKYATTSQEDDQQFFKLKKAFEDYNKDFVPPQPSKKGKKNIYEFDYLKGHTQIEDGSQYYKLEDNQLYDDEELKLLYDNMKAAEEITQETFEPLEIEDPDEPNSVLEGYDHKDPYFNQMF